MTSELEYRAPVDRSDRRRLTLLFTDLVGSSKLARVTEAEHYRAMLAKLRAVWHQTAAKHGGQVVFAQGDGALLVFGIPQPGEYDGRRAAEAALDIHALVAQLQPAGVPQASLPLQMHSGIHAGTLLLSDGDIERGVFDLTGDATNTTARLSQLASPGQILVTLHALGPNANFFALTEHPPAGLAIDNDEIRQQVRAVLGRGRATRRFEATAQRGLTPFIGRADLLDTLIAFLQASLVADNRCVVVQGGPGLGKTRLVEELLSRDDRSDRLVLRGGCENYLGAEVLQPFLQMLRMYFQSVAGGSLNELTDAASADHTIAPFRSAEDGAAIEAVRSLASDNPKILGRPTSTSGVVGDLLAFFLAASPGRRLLLVIDDWQWADDASRQLLQALLQIENGPSAILASRPRDDGGDWLVGAPHLSLSPFNLSETDAAVRRLLAQADPFLVERIHDYAGGVPLFIEELCHSVSADQVLRLIDGGRATQSWLATLVVSRLERLPPEQAVVVRAASVVGNAVPEHLLTAACGQAPSLETLHALADADFLRGESPGGGLRFKHGITRDAVYGSIGLYERTALHQRIQAALLEGAEQAEREDALEALAYHCRGAGHWALAARFAEQAGDKATTAFALDRARAQYLSAMDALEHLPELGPEATERWCQLANKLGMTCIFDPLSMGNDIGVFERSVVLARGLGNDGLLARTEYWLGYMCYGFGRFRDGVAHARQALQRARGLNDHSLAAQVEATLGQILAASGQYDEAIACMDTAVNAKQQRKRPGSGMAMGSAYTLACKGSVLADRGDFGSAHACFDEAMLLLADSTHPVANSVRNWVAVSLVWQGRWDEVELVTTESARIAENTRALLLLVVCRAASGFALWRNSRNPAGLQRLRDAVHWIEARSGQFYTSLYHGWLTEACIAEGELKEARHHAARALMRASEGERLGEAVVCRALADAAVKRGDFANARRWLKRADQSAQLRQSRREMALNQLANAGLQWAAGRPDEAQHLAGEAAQTLRTLSMHWHAAHAVAGPWAP